MKNMIRKLQGIRLKKGYQLIIMSAAFIALLGFAEKKQQFRKCSDISISIDNQYDNYFVVEEDVLKLMTQKDRDLLKGSVLGDIDLKLLEKSIETHQFVDKAEVSYNLGGELSVNIIQKKPIARVSQRGANDFYIGSKGEVLPVSERFTARVMLVDGPFVKQYYKQEWMQNDTLQDYIDFIQYVENHDFYKSLIAQIIVDQEGNINIYPQVGRQQIEFGRPRLMEHRFKKLKIFYKQILPGKGWDTYQKASLKYENQIICQ